MLAAICCAAFRGLEESGEGEEAKVRRCEGAKGAKATSTFGLAALFRNSLLNSSDFND